MLLQQLERELIITLGQRAVADHVGKHDRGEFALLDVVGGHARIKTDSAG